MTKWLSLGVLGTVAAVPVLGGVLLTQCPATNAAAHFSGIQIPVTGGITQGVDANSFQDVNGYPGGGCQALGAQFYNFNHTFSDTATPPPSDPTIAGVYLGTIGVTGSPESVTIVIGPMRGTGTSVFDGSANDGVPNWDIPSGNSGSNTLTATVTFLVVGDVSPLGGPWSTNQVVFQTFGIQTAGSTNNFATIVESICPGATSTSVDFSSCAGLLTGSFTNADGTRTFNLPTSTPSLAIQAVITLNTTGVNDFANINFFSNEFNLIETIPEPSTFVLLGTALAGLGLLRRRLKE